MIRIGFYLSTGCFGCEAAILDMLPDLPDFKVVWASPTMGDGKYDDIPKIDVAIVEGCVRTSENEEIVKILREKSKIFVALGTCACFGGIPGLANLHSKDEIFEIVYKRTLTTDDGKYPQKTVLVDGKYELTLPEIYEDVKPLGEVVDVDIFVPGCPPSEENIRIMFDLIERGKKGWAYSGKSVCESCPYKFEGGMECIERFFDVESCFISNNVLCFGPATSDCGALCTRVGVPCRGCFGPVKDVRDQGAKIIDFLSTIMSERAIEDLEKNYPNLAKMIYLYTLPSSIIRKRVRKYHVRDIG